MIILKLLSKICRKIKRIGAPPYIVLECKLEGHNSFGANTTIVRCNVGKYSYLGSGGNFYDTEIGRFCCIGNNVKIIAAQHPINYISVHPFFYGRDYGNVLESTFDDFKLLSNSTLPHTRIHNSREDMYNTRSLRAIIGHDVWIGDNVLIGGGVRIGTGAIVGMGAVVTKDVPSYAIVGGVPARIIRDRFHQDLIDNLLSIRWWSYPDEVLSKLAPLADKPQQFIEELRKYQYI